MLIYSIVAKYKCKYTCSQGLEQENHKFTIFQFIIGHCSGSLKDLFILVKNRSKNLNTFDQGKLIYKVRAQK